MLFQAQKNLEIIFDLIICDEAHRTTGVTFADEDESAFVKVHDNEFIKGKKRLYMTATPRIFSDDSKSKADRHDAVLCSMDDEKLIWTRNLSHLVLVKQWIRTSYRLQSFVLTLI